MDGQITLDEYLASERGYNYCRECEHAKVKDYVNGNPIFWCNVIHQYTTVNGIDFLCRNKDQHWERKKKDEVIGT